MTGGFDRFPSIVRIARPFVTEKAVEKYVPILAPRKEVVTESAFPRETQSFDERLRTVVEIPDFCDDSMQTSCDRERY
ncbi:hypothetical protein [Haladaptatus cibarius]|uniref:hypothetical protein n=1 Tax=Haladaptatus cibarius TaxID=453847 RepID=UPI0006794C91|nr:hypothetical protein [Haladaptatus cibarius]